MSLLFHDSSASLRQPSGRAFPRRSLLAGAGVGAAALGLAACGGSGGDDGATPQSDESHKDFVMTVWGGETDKEAYQARLDLAKKKFPDYTIKLQLIPSENYAQKVQTMISSKSGPDIMQVAEDVNVYASKQQLVPLDSYASDAGLDLAGTFGEGVGSLYSYEDKLYGVPDRSGAAILYFNKGLFEEKGIAAPTADWTWDDFSSAAKELTDPSKGQFGFAGFGWWPNWFAMIEQNGGHVIDPESGKPTVNSAEAVEAMQWIQDLMVKDKAIPTDADYANMGPDMGGDGAFNLGKVAMDITGFWLIGGAAEADIDWDISPVFHGKNSAVSAFGSALTVPKVAKNPKGSFEIIQFLTSAEGQGPIASRGQDVPANLEVQNSDTFLDPEWNTKDAEINLQAFPESADMIYTAPFIPEWNELQKACTDALANFWLGTADAKTSMDDLQSRLERVVK